MKNSHSRNEKGVADLSVYQRFELIIALTLTLLVSVVIVVATWSLLRTVVVLIGSGVIVPSRPEVFETIFGTTMIVLIALEFNHSLLAVVGRGRSIIQVRTVVPIARRAGR
jgi:Phosphate-starvation-inducible E family